MIAPLGPGPHPEEPPASAERAGSGPSTGFRYVCPECGAKLEQYAQQCPDCGADLDETFSASFHPGPTRLARGIAWGVLAMFALLAAAVVAAWVIGGTGPPASG